jgi:hypothetical protein
MRAAAKRLRQEVTAGWYRRVEAIASRYLRQADPARRKEGRERLAAVRDPLALLPLIRVLGPDAEPHVRAALAEHLGRFAGDDAAMQLLIMCLSDPSAQVRDAAAEQLDLRGDERPIRLLAGALAAGYEPFMDHAAAALQRMGRFEAVGALIDALVAPRGASKLDLQKATRAYLDVLRRRLAWQIAPQGAPGAVLPQIAALRPATGWIRPSDRRGPEEPTPPATTLKLFRTNVLEVLRALTGQDFGFDQRRWRRWWNDERKRRKLLPRLNE